MVSVAIAVSTPWPAHAGGSVLTFPRPWYRPGDQALGHDRVWFRQGYPSRPLGPFYAVLVPKPKWWNHLTPYPDNAIRLGRIQLRATAEPTIGLATVSFRVPDVPPGEYGISPCVSPCEGATGIGDLVAGGWFIIGSPVERQVEAARRSTEKDLRGLAVDQAGIAEGLQQLRGTLQAAMTSFRDHLAELRAAGGPGWGTLAGWIAAGAFGVLALVQAVTLRRQRRKVRPDETFDPPKSGVRFWVGP